MPLRYLFVDMNAYFASVEQHDRPELRGKPVAVVPLMAETTFALAASYEAKAFGIKTGTPVWEMKRKCPGIHIVEARPERYVRIHHQIVEAVGSVMPIETVRSIDEMACRLVGEEQHPDIAAAVGYQIKTAIRERVGQTLRCSVGIGPNDMLAKVAADMEKPDGLTIIDPNDLPHALHGLKLQDFPGIGPRMDRRLNGFGVFTAEQLCALTPAQMCYVWGSRVHGWAWWYRLRGEHVPEKPTRRQTVGHSHVLPPDLRTPEGAYAVLVRLTHKAAARLRKIGYWAGAVAVHVSFKEGGSWGDGVKVPHCEDTPGILKAVATLWKRQPDAGPAMKVGVVLADLLPAAGVTPSLFAEDHKATALSHAMDDVNREFGANVVHFGSMFGAKLTAPTRIAFNRIPEFHRVHD